MDKILLFICLIPVTIKTKYKVVLLKAWPDDLSCDYAGQILSYQKLVGLLQDAGNTTTAEINPADRRFFTLSPKQIEAFQRALDGDVQKKPRTCLPEHNA